MPANPVLIEQFREYCEAWQVDPEELEGKSKYMMMQCYYLDGILMTMAAPPKIASIDPRIIKGGG